MPPDSRLSTTGRATDPATSSGAPAPRALHGRAATSRRSRLRTQPFRVVQVETLDTWDPSEEGLPVTWSIHDRNARVRRGRVSYMHFETDRVLHTVTIGADRLTHGEDHQLRDSERWDGTLPESFGPRAGTKITGEMGPLHVLVEVWNTEHPSPATPLPGVRGRTARDGEWSDFRYSQDCLIDVVTEAKWMNDFCLPFSEEGLFNDFKRYGKVELDIQVKNLPEGHAVRLDVCRIGDVDDELTDEVYASSREDVPHDEPNKVGAQRGLLNPVVQDGRIALSDGRKPYVTFNRYAKHWIHTGNDFYCFKLYAVPDNASVKYVSEREKRVVEKRSSCLHMRFTVLIMAPASNLTYSLAEAQRLHRFLKRNTKYFRPFLLTNRRVNHWKLIQTIPNQYIVVFSGHSGCSCNHSEHPKIEPSEGNRYKRIRRPVDGRMQWVREERLSVFAPVLDEMFAPYQDTCPPKNVVTPEDEAKYRRLVRNERRQWAHPGRWTRAYARKIEFGWCSHRQNVQHDLVLNKVLAVTRGGQAYPGKAYLTHATAGTAPAPEGRSCRFTVQYKDSDGETIYGGIDIPNRLMPRLLLMAEGCKTMLTSNFGRAVCDAGTRFCTGWQYVSNDDAGLAEDLFKTWIDMASGRPEPEDECDPEALLEAYRRVASDAYRAKAYPTIMENGAVLAPLPDPARADEALE